MRRIEYLNLFICIIGIICLLASCNQVRIENLSSVENGYDKYIVKREKQTTSTKNNCFNIDAYMYNEEHPEYTPMKYIRVNIHFINSMDGKANFDGNKAIEHGKEVIKYANIKLADNRPMKLPLGNDTPTNPIPFRYVLTPNADVEGDQGVYVHYEENPFFISHGKNKNNYDKSIINKYAVHEDSILNIFYMVHSPDSIKSSSYIAGYGGIALGNSIKIGVEYHKDVKPWRYAGLINHEIGHVFTLIHAWGSNDQCDDTPPNPNCWNQGAPPCDGTTSNNVMDYNSEQTAYSPCQIGRMYRAMSSVGNRRDLVREDWCVYDSTKSITIRDSVQWNGSMDLAGDLTIERGGFLRVNCKIQLAKSASIYIKQGGELYLNNCTLYNDCNENWNGIFIESSRREAGILSYSGEVKIKNTEFTMPDMIED